MVRTQIQLSRHEVEEIKRLARERSVSMAAVIRDAIDQYVEHESALSLEERWRRSLETVGAFRSGGADLSQRHDEEFAAGAE